MFGVMEQELPIKLLRSCPAVVKTACVGESHAEQAASYFF